MLKTLQNAFKIKEVREKLLYTFFMLVVTRIGSQLPIPGVNTTFFQELFTRQSNDAFGFFNTITGGSFTNMSVFALSITPYITSSIIIQLLTIAIPKLEEMQQEGEDGRKMIAEYTRYLTVALALMQSVAMAIGFGGKGLLVEFTALNVIVAIVTMTAGSAMLMWIGERITENGVGNGISCYHFTGCRAENSGSVFEKDAGTQDGWRSVHKHPVKSKYSRCYSCYLCFIPDVFPGGNCWIFPG